MNQNKIKLKNYKIKLDNYKIKIDNYKIKLEKLYNQLMISLYVGAINLVICNFNSIKQDL